MQTAACNSFHPIEARAARWLLTAQDRAGDRLALTQEALAGLLGVQRTTVNAVARELQHRGLITTRRGTIAVVDRDGLKAMSCECYDRVEQFFGDIVGDSGSGRADLTIGSAGHSPAKLPACEERYDLADCRRNFGRDTF